MVPVIIINEINLNCSIQDLFYSLAASKEYEYICFLDSSLVPNKYSGFSYLAWEPDFAVFHQGSKNRLIKVSGFKKDSVLNEESDPLSFLRKVFTENINVKNEKYLIEKLKNDSLHSSFAYKASPIRGRSAAMPMFTGGFMGYFSYDLKDFMEKLPAKAIRDIDIPVYYLAFYTKLVAFCHKTGKLYFINMHNTKNGYKSNVPEEIIKRAIHEGRAAAKNLKSLVLKNPKKIKNHIENKYRTKPAVKFNLESNLSKSDYLEAVRKAKKYIHDGEIYQVNMTQRFKCRLRVDPWDLYYILRIKNPAPFSAFIGFPGLHIGSSSPERFLLLNGRTIQTRPIKGTKPRGKDRAEDKKNAIELSKSIKDRAELNMIVDLERNDLGRFCRYGTVSVKEHAVVEKYEKVLHLVSTIAGQVRKGHDIIDILKATFPGGSITGAPKIRAMEIIDELENTARNIYTGSIGYIGTDGSMDLNIVIRTFIIKDGQFYYNVGGGIVEDSEPESEYQETLDKGLALKETLEFFTSSIIDFI